MLDNTKFDIIRQQQRDSKSRAMRARSASDRSAAVKGGGKPLTFCSVRVKGRSVFPNLVKGEMKGNAGFMGEDTGVYIE